MGRGGGRAGCGPAGPVEGAVQVAGVGAAEEARSERDRAQAESIGRAGLGRAGVVRMEDASLAERGRRAGLCVLNVT